MSIVVNSRCRFVCVLTNNGGSGQRETAKKKIFPCRGGYALLFYTVFSAAGGLEVISPYK
jgi:hypothetical protein